MPTTDSVVSGLNFRNTRKTRDIQRANLKLSLIVLISIHLVP